MTETARIRWEPTKYGGWTGHVGTRAEESWLFQIWNAASVGGKWQLDSTLPGQFSSAVSADPDELKAEAERWLAGFVSSLGAVFPDEPGRPSRAWHADWIQADRDSSGNAILRHKPTGGMYKILPAEEC